MTTGPRNFGTSGISKDLFPQKILHCPFNVSGFELAHTPSGSIAAFGVLNQDVNQVNPNNKGALDLMMKIVNGGLGSVRGVDCDSGMDLVHDERDHWSNWRS